MHARLLQLHGHPGPRSTAENAQPLCVQTEVEARPLLFSNFMTVAADDSPIYNNVPSFDTLRKTLDEKLAEYNESNAVRNMLLCLLFACRSAAGKRLPACQSAFPALMQAVSCRGPLTSRLAGWKLLSCPAESPAASPGTMAAQQQSRHLPSAEHLHRLPSCKPLTCLTRLLPCCR